MTLEWDMLGVVVRRDVVCVVDEGNDVVVPVVSLNKRKKEGLYRVTSVRLFLYPQP